MSRSSEGARSVCFSLKEAHLILWALAEAMANAEAADALSDVAFLRPVIHLVHRRIERHRRSSVTDMASAFPATPGRITVVEAQRMTGVPGPELMRAIVSGELTWVEGHRHVYMVDPAEVEAWAARRSTG